MNRCLLDLDGPVPPPAPEDHWRVGGLTRTVRGICGPSRERCWCRSVAVEGGGTVPADPRRFMRAISPEQQAAPAWPAWPAECNDQPWANRLHG